MTAEIPAGAKAVICLAGLADGNDNRLARASFTAAQQLAQAGDQAAVFVTVQDTGGAFGHQRASIRRCWHGGHAALARTFAVEHPAASVKAVDCERADHTSTFGYGRETTPNLTRSSIVVSDSASSA